MEQVVYRVTPGRSAEAAQAVLRRGGLHPRLLDDSNPDPTLQYAAKGTYRVRIAVPSDEVQRAVALLQGFEAQQTAGVSSALSALRRQVVWALGIAVVVTIVLGLIREDGFGTGVVEVVSHLFVSLAAWTIGALILVAQVAKARSKLQRDRTATGWRRWACRLLLVGGYDAPFAQPESPTIRSERRRQPEQD